MNKRVRSYFLTINKGAECFANLDDLIAKAVGTNDYFAYIKHDKDTKERTRLNAAYALKQLRQKVDLEQKLGDLTPPEVTVVLNGKEYRALLTEQETGMKRGTATTSGVKGTVIRYALAGHGAFAEEVSLPEGSICYFCFADEAHCAIWKHREGWSGDSYE